MYLSLQIEAQEIMTEVGGTSLLDEGNTPVFPVIYPANEPRRVWDVVFKGEALNVGMLLSMKYANGVGAPGHWDTSGSDPVWVSDPPAPTGTGDTRPPRPMPVRNLLPNEKFQTGLMGVALSARICSRIKRPKKDNSPPTTAPRSKLSIRSSADWAFESCGARTLACRVETRLDACRSLRRRRPPIQPELFPNLARCPHDQL